MAEENESILGPKTFTASVKNSGLNDFIFLIDLNQDTCSVSDECVKFIKLPSANFWDAVKTITNVVHPDDQKFFAKCFDELKDKYDFIVDRRGMGFMQGLILSVPVSEVVKKCLEKGASPTSDLKITYFDDYPSDDGGFETTQCVLMNRTPLDLVKESESVPSETKSYLVALLESYSSKEQTTTSNPS